MSVHYRFGLVVSVDGDGVSVRTEQRCETKYEASIVAKKLALENPGRLFVSMECHEAFRSEPRVEAVWLEYPAQRVVPVASRDAEATSEESDEMPL